MRLRYIALITLWCFTLVQAQTITKADVMEHWLEEGTSVVDINNDKIINNLDWALAHEEVNMANNMTWIEDSAIAAKFQYPRVMHNNLLVGGDTEEASIYGTHVSDGISSWFGGKIASGYYLSHMWSFPDVGLFVSTLKGDSTDMKIQKAPDTHTDYTTVLNPERKTIHPLARNLVDCGRHDFSGTEKRVLLYFEYADGNASNPPRIFYSAQANDADAGNAGTWADLFSNTCDIRHFHGGVYIKNKGLYVMTGDTGTDASICFCGESDIADLITNPSSWYTTKWLFASGSRSGWSGTVNTNYIMNGNTQDGRIVDLISADNKIGYYIPDSVGMEQKIIKVDFYDTTTYDCGSTEIIHTGLNNTGWYGCVSGSGLIYITTNTYWATSNWHAHATGSADIICIDPATDHYEIVKSIPREDYNPARSLTPGTNTGGGFELAPFEYGGAIRLHLKEHAFGINLIGDQVKQCQTISGRVDYQKPVTENTLTNGDFATGDMTDWELGGYNYLTFTAGETLFTGGETITGQTSGATARVQGVILESGAWDGTAVGYVYCSLDSVEGLFVKGETITSSGGEATLNGYLTYEVVPDPVGTARNVLCIHQQDEGLPVVGHVRPILDAAQIAQLAGNFVTYSCDFYVDDSTTDNTYVRPFLSASITPGGQSFSRRSKYPLIYNTWGKMRVSTIAAVGATNNEYRLYSAISNSTRHRLFYAANFELVIGAITNEQIQVLHPDSHEATYFKLSDAVHVPPKGIFNF